MADPVLERELPEDEIEAMIRLINPEWRLREATFIADGISAIYRVRVTTPATVDEYYLKATPLPEDADIEPRVATEAHLTECVRRHTDIPVPTVIGAVDEHDAVRTPFFLMGAMPGHKHDMNVLCDTSPDSIASLARETGQYLGQLHNIDTPNLQQFGRGFTYDAESSLRGEQPRGDPTKLTFPDGYSSWPNRMQDWVEEDLDALAESDRFADLAAPIERRLADLVERLPTSVTPVVGRVDHGLWNLLTDEPCSRSTAWLDWGSLFAVPPAFDLAIVEYYLGGGSWLGLADVSKHWPHLRTALLEGYRLERPLPDAYELQRRCYLLDVLTASLSSLDDPKRNQRQLPEKRVADAAVGLRELVTELLGPE